MIITTKSLVQTKL